MQLRLLLRGGAETTPQTPLLQKLKLEHNRSSAYSNASLKDLYFSARSSFASSSPLPFSRSKTNESFYPALDINDEVIGELLAGNNIDRLKDAVSMQSVIIRNFKEHLISQENSTVSQGPMVESPARNMVRLRNPGPILFRLFWAK
jgi:hypothetical protein